MHTLNIKPSLPFVFPWNSQAAQYPENGEPGISYFKGELLGKWVDCYLYRGTDGKLQGILNYYPFDFPPYEQVGNVNIWVRPDHQREGIGYKLLSHLLTIHDINFEQQKYTEEGATFIKKYLKHEGQR